MEALTLSLVLTLLTVNAGANELPDTSSSINTEFLDNFNLTSFNAALNSSHPHANMNVVELISYYNYTVENHTVVTKDGYILALHRITGNNKKSSPNGKPAVLLMHGILSSSMDWVILGPKKSIGFLLAEAGYDVWIANSRGNRYCRNHKQLTVKDADFWDFSWHQIGLNDIPSMIDYILKTTGNEKIFYIGHSQGATVFFVMLHEYPEYNDKIKAMFALAPATYCSHMKSPLFKFLAELAPSIHLIMKLFGQHEFKPSDEVFKQIAAKYCNKNSVIHPFCTNILYLISGYNPDQMDLDLLPAIFAHFPAGSATKQFVHYAQLVKSGYFRQYDYGLLGNLKKYWHIRPPSYKLENVKVPVSVHYGVNDWLTGPEDVKKLYSQLPSAIGKFRVPHDKFNHLDFLWAKDVKTLLNDKIINLMSRF